jgi:ABC-type sugar transport system ATPase subunit
MNRQAGQQLDRLHIRIDSVTDRADSLSGGQRQAIAVARSVAWGRRVILMDEPTAALGVEEQQKVAGLIEEVRRNGVPVLLISHNIPQVHEICDRIVVLFHGRVVANLHKHEADVAEIVMWITGAALAREKGGFDGRPANER